MWIGSNGGETARVPAVLATGEGHGTAAGARPLPVFLTQLLACRDRLPAYRARRQADPDRAAASYARTGAYPETSHFERIL